ncbi:MAG: metallophosphoesterase [Kiritimatiellia bacterium]
MQPSPPLRDGPSRRSFLQTAAPGVLLALGLWPGRRAEAVEAAPPFRFIQVNDLHCHTPECRAWLARVAASMRERKPAFVLACGDLTDAGGEERMTEVRDAFATIGAPVYAVPGNHDYLAPDDRSAYDRIFPDRLNHAFDHGGWHFVGLDTTEGQKYTQTMISKATLDWAAAHARETDPAVPLVLFTHFPLGAGMPMRPLNADALLEPFRKHNLQAVFGGHHHGFTETNERGVSFTTNRCCAISRQNHDGSVDKGYFLCTAGPRGLYREFVRVPENS